MGTINYPSRDPFACYWTLRKVTLWENNENIKYLIVQYFSSNESLLLCRKFIKSGFFFQVCFSLNLTTVKSTVLLFAIRTVVHIFCCREMRVTHGIALNPKVEKGQDTNRRRKKIIIVMEKLLFICLLSGIKKEIHYLFL